MSSGLIRMHWQEDELSSINQNVNLHVILSFGKEEQFQVPGTGKWDILAYKLSGWIDFSRYDTTNTLEAFGALSIAQ